MFSMLRGLNRFLVRLKYNVVDDCNLFGQVNNRCTIFSTSPHSHFGLSVIAILWKRFFVRQWLDLNLETVVVIPRVSCLLWNHVFFCIFLCFSKNAFSLSRDILSYSSCHICWVNFFAIGISSPLGVSMLLVVVLFLPLFARWSALSFPLLFVWLGIQPNIVFFPSF